MKKILIMGMVCLGLLTGCVKMNKFYIENKETESEIESESQTRIIKPERFEDAKIAAKFMMEGFLNVVVDLSYIVTEENGKRIAERIIDFLYGVSLPLNLYVARVNETTFIFSKEHLNG